MTNKDKKRFFSDCNICNKKRNNTSQKVLCRNPWHMSSLFLIIGIMLSVSLLSGIVFAFGKISNNTTNSNLNVSTAATAPTNTDYWTDNESYYDTNWKGSGTEDDPWLIEDAADLAGLSYSVYSGTATVVSGDYFYQNKYFLQTANIDLSAHYWQPIGVNANRSGVTTNNYFSGNYNGGGYTISGLFTPSGSTNAYSYQGLFGYVKPNSSSYPITIKNIGITNSNIQGYLYVGGVVGYAPASSGIITITNCYNTGSVTGSGDSVGGVVGKASSGAYTITNSYNVGSVKGRNNVGGVVGSASASSGTITITNCYNVGSVIGSVNNIGGVVGYASVNSSSGTNMITNCYNVGSVTGTSYYVGGVVGRTSASSGTLRITNCYYGANCSQNIGGISGSDRQGQAEYNSSLTTETPKTLSWYTTVSNWNSGYPWDFENIWQIKSNVNNGFPSFIQKILLTFDAQGGEVNFADAESVDRTVTYNSTEFTYNCGNVAVTYNPKTYEMKLNGTTNGHIYFPCATNMTFKEGDTYKVIMEYVSGSTSGSGDCAVFEIQNNYVSMNPRNYIDFQLPTSGTTAITLTANSTAQANGNTLQGWFWFGGNARTFTNYKIKYKVVKVGETPSKTVSVIDTINAVTIPYREGFNFLGYYSEPNGNGTQYFDSNGKCVSQPNTNMTLYAYWEETWFAHLDDSFAGGSGDQNDPYLIETAGQLALISKNASSNSNYSGVYFKQTANIDLSAYTWVSISMFSGVYDGNYKCITGLKNSFCSTLSGATVKNLKLEDVNVVYESSNAGALANLATSSTITNIEVLSGNVEVKSGSTMAGGVVAMMVSGTISKCSNNANVSAPYMVGGIVGVGSSTISSCYNTGAIQGNNFVGGIIGSSTGEIKNCYNLGLTSGKQVTGGIVGAIQGIISHCVNEGTVSGSIAGGMVGQPTKDMVIEYCSNVGNIETSGICGGIVGAIPANISGQFVIDSCFVKSEFINKNNVIAASAVVGLYSNNDDMLTISRTGAVITTVGPNMQNDFKIKINSFYGYVLSAPTIIVDTSFSVICNPASPNENGASIYGAISSNNSYAFEEVFGWEDGYNGAIFDIVNWENSNNSLCQIPVPVGIYSNTEFMLNNYHPEAFLDSIAEDVIYV